MMRKRSLGYVALILFLGAIVGTALGEIIALILPSGVVKEFFLRSVSAGFGPVPINALLFTITLGFTFKLNVIGIIGILIMAYILRWYR